MKTKVLELATAKMVLGLLRSDELPGVAVQALEVGCNSPSLRILAGLTADQCGDARRLFDRALSELNVALLSKRDAVKRLARGIAKKILLGTTGAYDGANQIWELTLCVPDEELPELDPFVYAASEWEDRPEDRRVFGEGIIAAARDLVST